MQEESEPGIDEIADLISEWEHVANRTHSKIRDELRELTGTSSLEDPNPDSTNTENPWTGPWFLGFGAFGRALMYTQLSETGDIINRVVVKECDHNQTEEDRYLWDHDPSLFSRDDDGTKVPTEVVTMFDLRGKQGSGYIVKILNWRIAGRRRLFRIYLEVSNPVYQSMLQTTDNLAVRTPLQYASGIWKLLCSSNRVLRR